MDGQEKEYDLVEEARRLRTFRFLTDLSVQRLSVERLTLSEAYALIDELRRVSESLFPGKSDVFDLVIAPRLNRVINERFFKVS